MGDFIEVVFYIALWPLFVLEFVIDNFNAIVSVLFTIFCAALISGGIYMAVIALMKRPRTYYCADGHTFTARCDTWSANEHKHGYQIYADGFHRAFFEAANADAAARVYADSRRTTLISEPEWRARQAAGQRHRTAGGSKASAGSTDALRAAYQTPGAPPSADDAASGKARHRAGRRYHPDKLPGSDIPPQFVHMADEKRQQDNAVCGKIRQSRKKV